MITSQYFQTLLILITFFVSCFGLKLLPSTRTSLLPFRMVNNDFISQYHELKVPTLKGISLVDITPELRKLIFTCGVKEGVITVLSRHTTSAIVINEMEGRLVDDTRQFLQKLAPPDYPYLHNDLHLRNGPNNWPGGDEAWRSQEPVNAHSHLLAMLLGSSEAVPISNGELKIGQWQSVILVDLDGPRTRSVAVQITGTT